MQEPFHYAVAILLAGIFYRVLLHEDAVPHRLLAAALVMIVGAALVRPTWAVHAHSARCSARPDRRRTDDDARRDDGEHPLWTLLRYRRSAFWMTVLGLPTAMT